MEYDFERDLKDFFAGRVTPPEETRMALAQKLTAVQEDTEQRRTLRRCFLILLYAAVFSAFLLGILWIFFGSGLIILIISFYFIISIIGGLAIILALGNPSMKGGFTYVVLMD